MAFCLGLKMYVDNQIDGRVMLRSPGHTNNTAQSLSRFRKDNILCDITVEVEDKRFNAHKNILSSCSEYFKAMFTASLLESTQKEVVLQTLSAEVFEQILEFMYEGTISIDMITVVDMLHASSLMLMKEIETECYKFLKRNVNVTNCFKIKGIAEAYSNKDLINHCTEYIRKNFELLTKEEEVTNLSFNEFKILLSNADISCKSEDVVVNLLQNWLSYRNDTDVRTVHSMLKTVRLPFVTETGMNALQSAMKDLDAKQTTEEFSKVLNTECKLQTRNTKRKSIECRLSQKKEDVLLCVGRRGETYGYHVANKNFRSLDRFPENRQPGELLVNDNIVYAVGGCSINVSVFSASSDMLYSFNPLTCKWTTLTRMAHSRRQHCAAFMQGKLYVVGGKNLNQFVENLDRSVECYNPETNSWSHKHSTTESRINASMTSSNRYIYVIGGESVNINGLNTAEKYCPRKDSWEKLPDLNHKRISSSAVFFNEKVFVFGGSNGIFDLTNFEFLESNEKQWSVVSIPYATPISIVLPMNDKILALGSSAWGEDLVLQYSFVRRRGVHWKAVKEFIHSSHRVRSMKYAVMKMVNYDLDRKPVAQCDCTYFENDSSLEEESFDMSSEDEEGWMDLDPWGLWV